MLPKPKHLAPEYGAQFQDPAIVAAYHHRPPYPPGSSLSWPVGPRGAGRVLDLGCGTGDVARPLAPLVARVDAVDISPPMIAKGAACPAAIIRICAGSWGRSRTRRWTRPMRWSRRAKACTGWPGTCSSRASAPRSRRVATWRCWAVRATVALDRRDCSDHRPLFHQPRLPAL